MASPVISLRTSDDVLIKTNIETARGSIKILSMLEDNGYEEGNEATLQLPEVNSVILEKILEWTSFHKKDGEASRKSEEEKNEWNNKYLKVDPGTLFEILLAAEYLDIQELLEMSCKKVVGMIRGHSLEKIRENFGLRNDFTKEEEEQIRKENEWCDNK